MTRAASASRIIASSRPTRSALSTTPPSTSPTTSFSSSRPRAPFTHHARRHLCTVRAHNLSPQRRAQKRKKCPATRPQPPPNNAPATSRSNNPRRSARCSRTTGARSTTARPAASWVLHALFPGPQDLSADARTHARRIRVHRPRHLQLPVGPLAAAAGARADTGEQVAAGLAGAEGVDNGVGRDAGRAGGVSAG